MNELYIDPLEGQMTIDKAVEDGEMEFMDLDETAMPEVAGEAGEAGEVVEDE